MTVLISMDPVFFKDKDTLEARLSFLVLMVRLPLLSFMIGSVCVLPADDVRRKIFLRMLARDSVSGSKEASSGNSKDSDGSYGLTKRGLMGDMGVCVGDTGNVPIVRGISTVIPAKL